VGVEWTCRSLGFSQKNSKIDFCMSHFLIMCEALKFKFQVPDVVPAEFYSQGRECKSLQTAICVKNGNFQWGDINEEESDTPLLQSKFSLNNINFDILQVKLIEMF